MAWKSGGSLAAIGMVAFAVACEKSSTEEPAASRTCDPLAVGDPPAITLRTILAAGRAPDGTLYVIDHGGSRPDLVTDERLFKSTGNVLQRVDIRGSGSGPDFFIADFAEGQVRVELANGAPTRMGLTNGQERDPSNKSFDIDQATELTLEPLTSLGGYAIADTAPSVGVMYAATARDGRRLIVFQRDAASVEATLRPFFGTPDRMVEGRTTGFSRGSSLGYVRFDLEGVGYTAQLTFGQNAMGFSPQLDAAGIDPIPLEPDIDTGGNFQPDAGVAGAGSKLPLRSPAELAAGLRFVCF